MKTFAEAMDMFKGENQEEALEKIRKIVPVLDEFREEIMHHPGTKVLVEALMEDALEGIIDEIQGTEDDDTIAGQDLGDAIFSAFMHGIVIGREMEKQDLVVAG